MIEPLLWSLLCAIAIAMCWANMRRGSSLAAFCIFCLAIVYALSAWDGFSALLAAMEALSAGEAVKPYRVTIFVVVPVLSTLAWPFVREILSSLKGHAHGSA